MKSKTFYLKIKTQNKIEFLNITEEIKKRILESNIKEGICLVNSMRITSSVLLLMTKKLD